MLLKGLRVTEGILWRSLIYMQNFENVMIPFHPAGIVWLYASPRSFNT